jgi:hypothetical protein
MQTQQADVNAQRDLASANLGLTDIESRQKDALTLFKDTSGASGNGMMSAAAQYAFNRWKNIAGVGGVDKLTGEVRVAANHSADYQKLLGQYSEYATKVEESDPSAFAQVPGGAKGWAKLKADQDYKAMYGDAGVVGAAARPAPGAAPATRSLDEVALTMRLAAIQKQLADPTNAGNKMILDDLRQKEYTTANQLVELRKKQGQPDTGVAVTPSGQISEGTTAQAEAGSGFTPGADASPVPAVAAAPQAPAAPVLPTPAINKIQGAGDTKRAENIAATQQDYRKTILENSAPAQTLQSILNEVEQSAANLKGTTLEPDAWAPVKSQLLQFVKAAGWKLSPEEEANIANATDIQKLNSMLASVATKQVSARPGVYEFATFQKNNPGLDMTPASLQKLIGFMRNTAQVTTQLPTDYSQWLKDHPRGDPQDFDSYVTSLRANPGYWGYLRSKGLPSTYAEVSAAAAQQGIPIDTMMDTLLKHARKYKGG